MLNCSSEFKTKQAHTVAVRTSSPSPTKIFATKPDVQSSDIRYSVSRQFGVLNMRNPLGAEAHSRSGTRNPL